MKRLIFIVLMVYMVAPQMSWAADDFDHDLLRIYDHNTGELLVEDSNGETGDQRVANCNNGLDRRLRLEISFEAEEEIESGEFEVQIWSNSGEARLLDGDSNTSGSGFWRDVPSLDEDEIITFTEYILLLPEADDGDSFYIRLDDQSIRFHDGRRTDDDDRIDFEISGSVACQASNDILPTASIIQGLPDVIFDDDLQIFIGRSQRTDYRSVWQQTNAGAWNLVDSVFPTSQSYYRAENLETGNCYAWKSFNHNSYGETESNIVSTCVDSYNEDFYPELSTSDASFVDNETKTINISNVPNAFTYHVEMYRDDVYFNYLETDRLSFDISLSSDYSEYSFRARAHYTNGQNSIWGDELVLVRNGIDLLPSASTLTTLANITYGTSITLDIGDSERTNQRRVYQRINTGSYTLLDTIDEVNSYTINNLSPGNSYSYYVINVNSNGTSPNSNIVSTHIYSEQGNNLPPEITSFLVSDSRFLGNTIGMEIVAHEPDDDIVSVEWYLDDQLVKSESLILPNRESSYEFTPTELGIYTLKAVVSDPYGLFDEYEFNYDVNVARINDPDFFQVITWIDGSLLYDYNGSLYNQEQFTSTMHHRFGSLERVIEPVPGMGENWFSIQVLYPEDLTAWDAAGDVLLGLTDRCSENTGDGCLWAAAVFSSIPVVEEFQEGISVVTNTVCFLYEGSAYFISGDPKYKEARNRSATNVGVAAVSFMIPWVVDPQGAKVYYKLSSEAIPNAVKFAVKNGDVVSADDVRLIDSFLASKGYDAAAAIAARSRVAKLNSLHPMIKEAKNVEFFAEVARDYGPERADYLVKLLEKFEKVEKESQVLLPGFINSKNFSLQTAAPAQIDKFFRYEYFIKTRTKFPGSDDIVNDVGNAKGAFAEERGAFFFDLVGSSKKDSLESKDVWYNQAQGYTIVNKNSPAPTGYNSQRDKYLDLDSVRVSPYNHKEIWFTEIKYGSRDANLPKIHQQLSKINDDFLQYLVDTGKLERDVTVRRIAMVDEEFDELDPLLISWRFLKGFMGISTCYANLFPYPISDFVVPANNPNNVEGSSNILFLINHILSGAYKKDDGKDDDTKPPTQPPGGSGLKQATY